MALAPVTRLGFATLLAAAPGWGWAGQVKPPGKPAPRIVTIAGTGEPGYSGDGRLGSEGELNNPYGLTIGPDGALYICEVDNNVVRRLDPRRDILSTVAGNVRAGYSGDHGPAVDASMRQPYEVRFDAAGNMYVVERLNHVVRRVDHLTHIITTIAGSGKPGFGGDGGPATRAMLREPHSIAFDKDGNLLICDIGNHRLRRVNMKTGVIDTIAGNGEARDPRDGGPYRGAPLNGPRAVDVDRAGRIYLAVREGNAVYRLDPDGAIHRIAGTGERGYSGDNGPALSARLAGPKGISWSAADDSLYLADTENQVIRRVDLRTGIITTIAGNGARGDGPDGDPLQCRLARPHGIHVDPAGVVYIGDSENHRVRRIVPVKPPRKTEPPRAHVRG